jgi:hypothetical protein
MRYAAFALSALATLGCDSSDKAADKDTSPSVEDTADTSNEGDSNAADSNTADSNAADSNAADSNAADSNAADSNAADSNAADSTSDAAQDTGSDTAASNPCEALGGLCIGGNPSACTDNGGKLAAAGDNGCVFDDGPGLCCIPPTPADTGSTCESHGGICAPIAGCNFVNGNFAPPSCFQQGGPGTVCCVPQSICGPETMYCCNDMTTFRPMCDRGEFTCDAFPDTEMKPREQCP